MNWQNFKRVAFFTAVFIELVALLTFFFVVYGSQDHAEHLHASWLVWQGKLPYVDFFEHHHPLLWYLMAPVVALFYKNVMIFYVARLVNATVYAVMFWGLYKISCDFLKTSKKAFIMALMLFFLYPPFLSSFFEFAPDSFMFASFVWGLWFYFKFLENKQQGTLNLSFILWTVSFLFLQKVLFMLFVPCVYILYLAIKKEISFKNIIKAVIIPVVIIGIFLSYLNYHHALHQFILFNYDLNFWMCKLKGGARFPKFTSLVVQIGLFALFCLYDFLKVNSKYRFIFTGLIIGDFVFKWLTWAPWVQYFVLIRFGVLLIISQEILFCKFKSVSYFLLTLMISLQLISYRQCSVRPFQRYYLNLQNFIMTNSHNENDIIINTNGVLFNIYGKNPHYYWFGLHDIASLSYYLYELNGEFNINDVVERHKPVFLFKSEIINSLSFDAKIRGEDYHKYLMKLYDKFPNKGEGAKAFADYWDQETFYKIDDEIFDKYYKPINKPYLFIRKDAPELKF